MIPTSTLAAGYSISRIIKGGWHLAGGHGSIDRAQALRDMAAFVEAGITTFDCADIYTGVEETIGEFRRRLAATRGAEATRAHKVHTKFVPNDFGGAMKMLVALDTGAKVWVSIPDAIGGFDLKNKMVAFTATFTVSDTDPLFAFGKRPSNATILSDVTDDVAKAAHDTAVMNAARDARMNSDGLPPLTFAN